MMFRLPTPTIAFAITILLQAVLLFVSNEGAVIPNSERTKLIIDCDPGGDDAFALLELIRKPSKVEILALTITFGNTFLDQAAKNALRILKLTDRLDIPIYLGFPYSLTNLSKSFDNFFGNDGFGDFNDDTVINYAPYMNRAENATQALRRLVGQNPNKVTLLAIGPLTNLAHVLEEDSSFGTKLHETIIMGGNYKGVGNVRPTAEFNFYEDPEAANEVMTKWKGKILLITWELCLSAGLPWEWYDSHITGKPNKYAKFLHNVGTVMRVNTAKQNISTFTPCDQLAAAILINRSVVKTSVLIDCRVEYANETRRGENIVDWRSTKPDKNVWLVTEVNLEISKKILSDATRD